MGRGVLTFSEEPAHNLVWSGPRSLTWQLFYERPYSHPVFAIMPIVLASLYRKLAMVGVSPSTDFSAIAGVALRFRTRYTDHLNQ
jgi:hypothetical protein